MNYLLRNITNLLTCHNNSLKPKKGKHQQEIGLIKNGFIWVNNEVIQTLGSEKDLKKLVPRNFSGIEIDCTNMTVMPGFIDSHTHLVFAGSREDEYEMRIKGFTYEQIADRGGGIKKTVMMTRLSSEDELKILAQKRLDNFIQYGVTTLEAKSGYGLDFENELKLLKVISDLNENNQYGIDILPTFLGAHVVPDRIPKAEYIREICQAMIPEIARQQLAKFIDVFCEKNYFTPSESETILLEGIKHGLQPKIHTNQFHSIGGIETALKVSVVSADHLEVLSSKEINKLSGTNIVAVCLPGVSYFLGIPYSPARQLIEKNIPIAIATDFNPGSCMSENLQFIMSLASTQMHLTGEEIINAVTYNAACALNIQHLVGSISFQKYADLLVFDFPSYKELIYHFGVNLVRYVFKKGKIVMVN
ncbi:MAG: imidazolonepropionase [Ignavibacteria bacterium]